METISSDRAELQGTGFDLVVLYCLRSGDREHPCELRVEDVRTAEREVRPLKNLLGGEELASILGLCAQHYKTSRVFFKICTGPVPDLTPEMRKRIESGDLNPVNVYNNGV